MAASPFSGKDIPEDLRIILDATDKQTLWRMVGFYQSYALAIATLGNEILRTVALDEGEGAVYINTGLLPSVCDNVASRVRESFSKAAMLELFRESYFCNPSNRDAECELLDRLHEHVWPVDSIHFAGVNLEAFSK